LSAIQKQIMQYYWW